MLQGKRVILGVTGSIAAYKAVALLRLLTQQGAEVHVLMTEWAKKFVTPLTFSSLSGRPVLVEAFNPENGQWNSHIELGTWADIMVIAPATANTIGKMATGIADNLLLTTYLSARCPVMVAPAMDLDMYSHPAHQKNLDILRSFGNIIIEPASGELASGLKGKGRLVEPEILLQHIRGILQEKRLAGKHFLVTAGPTHEAIDPVRFIGNRSSGKMGYAIAAELIYNGASVTLISGPVKLKKPHPDVHLIRVTSADEMYKSTIKYFKDCDGAVLSAAVADYRPNEYFPEKYKSGNHEFDLKLVPNPDIAWELGKIKDNHQILVGFALETEDGIRNAQIKLQQKNLNFIILNELSDEGAGFEYDTNKITLLDNKNNVVKFELKTKTEVAKDIVDKIVDLYKK